MTSKELYVSSTPHETKVAIVEDDQLAEIYFERENEYTLAGSIYKGRVTRVLPGMQSAFVDIGLERDAFLYVSDFFEVEDEDEEFEPVALPRPMEARPQPPAPPQEAAAPPAAAIEEQVEASEEVAPAAEQPHRQEPQERGDRGGWRGRHRGRRGRRGRGFSDAKYAREPEPGGERPERPESREFGAPPGYQPIILPGESLSKFNRPEPPAEAAERPERPERPEHGERVERLERPERPERQERARDFGPPPGYQPIILPGESISKYQHLKPAPAAAEVEPETPTEPLPASLGPESQSGAPEVAAAPAEPEAETAAPAQPQAEAPPVGAAIQEQRHEEQETPEEKRERERRFEQMNVASVFGGAEAVPPDGSNTVEEVQSELHASDRAEAEAGLSAFSAASAGTFAEEEIEEEEGELPGIHEHFDDADFEELEEETIEPAEAELSSAEREELAAGEAAEALEDTEAEQAAEDDSYDLEENGGAEEGETFVEQEESAEGRAEVRGAAGTAGYQQGAQRFDRGRRGGGGRFGRRMRPPRRDAQRQHIMISDVLKEGQEVLIQIAKEPIGKKGARITSHIALPGRFLVYMPTVNHVGVSRKIMADEERQRLKRIVTSERENGHGGFIVRTAAEHVSEDDLRADIRFLKNLWNEIKTRADNSKPPALIYHDLNLVERVLRDQVTADFATVWVDTESEYERILRFANRFQPGLVRKVKLYTKETPLFEQFGVQEEINKSLKSKVWLKSGGYIVINQTEALVAIDVNTGKYVGKTTRLEDTIVKTNVDAIKEIVRQIRLRDLGGIIVIDFIDMDERRNRQKVMQALDEELKNDRAPSKVLAFNDFGLVAITRKRVKQSLERTLGTPCPYCSATGFVKSVPTVCNEIYTELRKLRRHLPEGDVLLRVNPEVAKALKANGGKWQQELEELVGRTVIIKSDASLHQEQFDI
jgi:ribonuclease G